MAYLIEDLKKINKIYEVGDTVYVTHKKSYEGADRIFHDEKCKIIGIYKNYFRLRTCDRKNSQLVFCMDYYDFYNSATPMIFKVENYEKGSANLEIWDNETDARLYSYEHELDEFIENVS